jgi:hypothetical protein
MATPVDANLEDDLLKAHEINVTPFIDPCSVSVDHLHGGGAPVDRRPSGAAPQPSAENIEP